MSVYFESLKREGEKRIKQLEYIREKFGRLTRSDMIMYSPLTYIQEVDKDVQRIRSNLKVVEEVYEGSGALTNAIADRFGNFFRAIVVYSEVVFELRQLLDCAFGVNICYYYLNPDRKEDKEAELNYLAEHPDKVAEYLELQRKRLRETQNAKYVKIDEAVPYGL